MDSIYDESEAISDDSCLRTEEFEPRDYQTEIFEAAKKENVIVKLDTGSGKTYIAIMLMKFFLPLTNEPIQQGGKRIVFLVQNIHLVYQQAAAILHFLPLGEHEVGRYHGDIKGVGYSELWTKHEWFDQFDNHRILVITADVFLSILRHSQVHIKDICLLIFDECHHSVKMNSYAHICKFVKEYYNCSQKTTIIAGIPLKLPRILGLTATIIKGNIKNGNKYTKLQEKLFFLERTMCSRVVTSFLHLHQSAAIKEEVVEYKRTLSPRQVLIEGEKKLIRFLGAHKILTVATNGETKNPYEKALRSLKNAQRVLEDFGIAGCVGLIKSTEAELRHLHLTTSDNVSKEAIGLTLKTYDELLRVAKLNTLSPKISALMDVLSQIGKTESSTTISNSSNENNNPAEEENYVTSLSEYTSQMNMLIEGSPSSSTVSISSKRPHEPEPDEDSILKLQHEHRLNLLKDVDSSRSDKETFRGIIFVRERKHAYALLNVLQMIIAVEPNKFGFLKPAVITGHGKTPVQGSAYATTIRQQEKILSRFRYGEFNLLVATKVVEEGLDVPHCNLVIQLEPPEEFRSYIQAKGRARKPNSRYVVFCLEEVSHKVNHDLKAFRDLNEEINKLIKSKSIEASNVEEANSILHNNIQNAVDRLTDDVYFPFGPYGPRISYYDAVAVLNKYIGSLRSDSIGLLKLKVDYICTDKTSRVNLTLPRPCPIFDVIKGPECGNKRKAKQLAALEACKLLHSMGELDESLLPYRRGFTTDFPDDDDTYDEWKHKAGTAAAKRTYKVSIAHSISSKQYQVTPNILDYIAQGRQLHVQILKFEPDLHECLKEIQPSSLLMDENSLAILSPVPIRTVSTIAQFPLILPSETTTNCRIEYVKAINGLTKEDAEKLLKAHQALFHILSIQQRAAWFQKTEKAPPHFIWDWQKTRCLFILCPVNKVSGDIMWNCVDDLYNSSSHSYKENILFSRDKSEWCGGLVLPLHTNKDCRPCIVVKVCEELSPDSEIPDSSSFEDFTEPTKNTVRKNKPETFRSFYQRQYPQCTINPVDKLPQPMLSCIRVPSMGSSIRKRSTEKADQKGNAGEKPPKSKRFSQKPSVYNTPYLIPQLCEWIPLSPSLYIQLRLFPDIWYRLNQLLLTEELFEKMAPTMGWKSLQNDPLVLDFEGKAPLQQGEYMNPTRLLNALTCIECHDLHNLERLEVLGDSFLKYISSVYLHNLIRPTQQEGVMTKIRSSIICNKNLYRWAIHRYLHRYVYPGNWVVKVNFLPPGCIVNPNSPPNIQNQYEEVTIHDKKLADCVEALLGCTLQYSDQLSALKLMRWLSFDNTVSIDLPTLGDPLRLRQWYTEGMSDTDADNAIETAYNDIPTMETAFINPTYKGIDRKEIESLILGRDMLEKKLGHVFRDPLLILEATSHPSDSGNQFTNCYQRLEFLGDAAIDFLVTIRIFHDYPSMSPGELTDLRSALVNNNLFATLAVKYDFHKCIRYENSILFDHINSFVRHQTEIGHPVRDNEYTGEDGEKVMLKVLGDVIESLMGAILVDSEMNLHILDKVIFSLMGNVISDFASDVPKSPIRLCYEKFPDVEFKKPVVLEDLQLISLTAICNGETFVVRERNARLCRHVICRNILQKFPKAK